MRVGIHQPHYLPWLRYFEKIARSDVFIVLDDVQYEKNGFQNRNKIKTPQGWTYLTVPVRKPTLRPIREMEIDHHSGWAEKHRRSIEMSYRKAPHFAAYWPEIEALYAEPGDLLGEFNRRMVECFCRLLGISTRLVLSSEIETHGESTERIAELCRAVGGDVYLSGAFAVGAYLDPAVLKQHGVRLAFQEWHAPIYPQVYPNAGFVPDLAIVDLLFSQGPASLDLLLSSGSVQDAPDA